MICVLTEMVEGHEEGPFGQWRYSKIFPGLCDTLYMRRFLGEAVFDLAVRLGVIVEIP